MQACPDKNNELYIELVKEFGDIHALSAFHLLGTGEIPTVEQAHELFKKDSIDNPIPDFDAWVETQNPEHSFDEDPLNNFTSEQPTLFDNPLPFNDVKEKILKGFTKYTLYPKRIGDVKLKDSYTTKEGKMNKEVAKSMQNWVDGIPEFKSAQIEYSPVENAIRIMPSQKFFPQTGSITGNQYVNPTIGNNYTQNVTPTSETNYKDTNNLDRKSVV